MIVIKEWIAESCTWKQQTVILSALRGCDGIAKEHPSKNVSRLFRLTILKNADTSSGYMSISTAHKLINVKDFIIGLDTLPLHYVFHLMHAIEIVGYKHPNGFIDEWYPKVFWFDLYMMMCRALHINPETEEQMEKRLEDKII